MNVLRDFGVVNAQMGNAFVWVGLAGHKLTVQLVNHGDTREEAGLLMELEDRLQQLLGLPVEIYLEARQDDNKPRQRQEKVLDWVQRRGMLGKSN